MKRHYYMLHFVRFMPCFVDSMSKVEDADPSAKVTVKWLKLVSLYIQFAWLFLFQRSMAAVAKDGQLFVVSFDTLHGGWNQVPWVCGPCLNCNQVVVSCNPSSWKWKLEHSVSSSFLCGEVYICNIHFNIHKHMCTSVGFILLGGNFDAKKDLLYLCMQYISIFSKTTNKLHPFDILKSTSGGHEAEALALKVVQMVLDGDFGTEIYRQLFPAWKQMEKVPKFYNTTFFCKRMKHHFDSRLLYGFIEFMGKKPSILKTQNHRWFPSKQIGVSFLKKTSRFGRFFGWDDCA